MRRRKVISVVAGIVITMLPVLAGPGFPLLRKRLIALRTRQPALIRLSDTTIAFVSGVTNPEYSPVAASLLDTLETEVLKNERTLVKKATPAEAEWALDLRVTGYALPPSQKRTEGSGTTLTQYTRWIGSLNAAYQVLDHSGKSHTAQNVSSNYDREFSSSGIPAVFHLPPIGRHQTPSADSKGKEPKTLEDLKQILISDVVTKIAATLGNTSRVLEVQVATGEDHLSRAAVFMDDRLWSRALDLLDSTPAFPKPEEEAYRQYDLGLTYEAVSYESKDANDQRQNIYKAAEYYDKALELNPKERYFVDSVARSKDAISRYRAIDDEMTASAKQPPSRVAGGNSSLNEKPKNPTAAPQSVFTAKDAIDLFSNHVPEESILEMIHSSPVQFDPLDKPTAINMAKARLPLTIQNEMRKKVGAAPLGSGTSSSSSIPARRPVLSPQ